MLFRSGPHQTTDRGRAGGVAVEGKLDLDAPVSKYIAGLPPRARRDHREPSFSATRGPARRGADVRVADDASLGAGIRAWTDEWLFTQPGKISRIRIPDIGWTGICGSAVRKAYAAPMEARVFRPLEMTHTTTAAYAGDDVSDRARA